MKQIGQAGVLKYAEEGPGAGCWTQDHYDAGRGSIPAGLE